ncbi:hypothetical protein C0Q70_02090 [Pomacea canaliculata]|uniref:Armadillo repeat-containing domain-containing protein n=1 Tax=Pomacea canaliculata TaxID=400727 RepID=A0A2T7Q1B4_POMCA|nr:hypothetical protein C0Q70_02090 [Pomacea canaliculata]
MGRKQVCETGILDTLLEVVEREETGASLCQVLEQLNSLAENVETMRNRLAEGSLPSHLVRIIQFNSGKGSQDREECVKLSSDLLLSLLVGDAHCKQLVDVGIVEALLSGLAAGDGAEPSFTLQHAVLSSLRNLAIPASNKARLLEAGVMRAVLELKHTEVMAVVFKLLGVLRMLTDGQEAAALALGQDHDFLVCLVDWCAVEEHAGVKAVRLLASMIKNSKSSQVMRNIVREEGLPHLVSMATSEHLVMQNEALIALTLVASTIPGDAAVSLKEADLVGTVSGLVKNKSAPAELLCNVLTLVRSLSTADNLRQDLVTSGLLEHLRWMSGEHSNQGVKDAATSTLAVLEEELNRKQQTVPELQNHTVYQTQVVLKNCTSNTAEELLAEEQAGFRPHRSTVEHINFRILIEKHLQNQQDLYHNFIE